MGGNPISRIDPFGLACNGLGCWNTPSESAYANSGNYGLYYQAACSGGDSYACSAGQVAADIGWQSHFTNRLLENSLKMHDPSLKDCAGKLANEMEQIRADLAKARVDALTRANATPSNPVNLPAQAFSDFHHAVFDQFGGAVFGGDIPGSNLVFGWCSSPSCH